MKVVAIGGSTRPHSSTQRVLDSVLGALAERGAECEPFCGQDLAFAPYEPGIALPPTAERMIKAIRECDAVPVGRPRLSRVAVGLVKNALDYLEALRDDARPYLSDRPVGLVGTAHGWQAAVTTLTAMRQIVHALRGWPTPLGIAVNVADLPEGLEAALASPALGGRVEELAHQMAGLARGFAVARVDAGM